MIQKVAKDRNSVYENRDLLCFYGLLSPREQQRVVSDGLSLAQLGKPETILMQRFLFGWRSELKQAIEPKKVSLGENAYMMQSEIALTPSIALASGIPGDAYVKIDDQSDGGVTYGTPFDLNGPMPNQVLSVDDLAREILHPRNTHANVNGQVSVIVRNGTHLRYVKRRRLTVTVHLTGTVTATPGVLEGLQISDQVADTYRDLPAGLRSEVEAAMERIRKQEGGNSPVN